MGEELNAQARQWGELIDSQPTDGKVQFTMVYSTVIVDRHGAAPRSTAHGDAQKRRDVYHEVTHIQAEGPQLILTQEDGKVQGLVLGQGDSWSARTDEEQ